MDALFRQVGIYAHTGQLYEPVDADNLLFYKEAEDGQILEEVSRKRVHLLRLWLRARRMLTTESTRFHFIFTTRCLDSSELVIWHGWQGILGVKFLLGATAGRTTLAGEGCSTKMDMGM